MNISLKLNEKSFTNDKGEVIAYYNLSYTLFDGSILELPIKGDKAKLLLLSIKATQGK